MTETVQVKWNTLVQFVYTYLKISCIQIKSFYLHIYFGYNKLILYCLCMNHFSILFILWNE